MYDKGWQVGKWKAMGSATSDNTVYPMDGFEGNHGNWNVPELWWNQGPGQQQQPEWQQGLEVLPEMNWKEQGQQSGGDYWVREQELAGWKPKEQHAQDASEYSNWTSLASEKGSPGMRQKTNLNPFRGWTGVEAIQQHPGHASNDGLQVIADLLKKNMDNQQQLICQRRGKEYGITQSEHQDWRGDKQWSKYKGKQTQPILKVGKNLGKRIGNKPLSHEGKAGEQVASKMSGIQQQWSCMGQQQQPMTSPVQEDMQYHKTKQLLNEDWSREPGKEGRTEEENYPWKGMGKRSTKWNKTTTREQEGLVWDGQKTTEDKKNAQDQDGKIRSTVHNPDDGKERIATVPPSRQSNQDSWQEREMEDSKEYKWYPDKLGAHEADLQQEQHKKET